MLLLTVLGVATIVDWTFLVKFADRDVPIYVQFFNLGAQIGLFSIFNKYLELGPPERCIRAVKRVIWFRRFGIVTLTIFTIGRFSADGIFWVLEKILGPAVDFSGIDPVLAWNVIEIYLFMVFDIVHLGKNVLYSECRVDSWVNFLDYKNEKKKISLYEFERIYGPTKIDPGKNSEDAPTLTT